MSSANSRSRRTPAKKKPASPSYTSLFSSITKLSASSSGSNGSNSTITPRTVSNHQRHASSLGRDKHGTPSRGSTATRASTRSHEPSKPDVFAFMETRPEPPEDADEKSDSSSSQEERKDAPAPKSGPVQRHTIPPPAPMPTPKDRRTSSSLHSDSGISVQSGTPESDKTPKALGHNQNQPTLLLDWDTARSSHASNVQTLDSSAPFTHTGAGEHILAPRHSPSLHHRVPPPPFAIPRSVPSYDSLPPAPAVTSSRIRQLAQHISSHAPAPRPPPLYRRFEHLTNQLLLQLQTELASIEAELAAIDAAARRPSKQRPPAEGLRWHRAQLAATAGARLDVYHRLLTSYDRLGRLPPASPELAELHRRFLHLPDRASAAGIEFAYLDALEDVALVAAEAGGGRGPRDSDGRAVLPVAAAALIAVAAFRCVPALPARIALGVLVAGALVAAGWLPRLGEDDWRIDAGVYGAASVLLAVAVA